MTAATMKRISGVMFFVSIVAEPYLEWAPQLFRRGHRRPRCGRSKSARSRPTTGELRSSASSSGTSRS
jgi:hypothetical protein